MEFPILIAFFTYLFYLRQVAGKKTTAEIEEECLEDAMKLYYAGNIQAAFQAFENRIAENPKSSIAYLYRGLCYCNLGNREAAAKDFRIGIAYDNLNAELFTELGKLQKEQLEMEAALASFASAIRVSRGQSSEPYHERGVLLKQLNRGAEAELDFEAERFIRQQELIAKQKVLKAAPGALFDRKMLLNSLLVILTSAILVITVKTASSIHLPYLTAVVLSTALGYAEPRRGWILAILQSIILLSAIEYFLEKPASQGRVELEYFSMFGAIALTFTSSFLGAFLRNAVNS